MAIKRIWHGWTEPDNAIAYQELLNTTIAPGIMARAVPGLRRLDVLRRAKQVSEEIQVVIMTAYSTVESAVEAMKLGLSALLD